MERPSFISPFPLDASKASDAHDLLPFLILELALPCADSNLAPLGQNVSAFQHLTFAKSHHTPPLSRREREREREKDKEEPLGNIYVGLPL